MKHPSDRPHLERETLVELLNSPLTGEQTRKWVQKLLEELDGKTTFRCEDEGL